MNIIFLDTETTDLELEKARLVQLAYKDSRTGEVMNEYFKPPTPISYGSMAVHHITNSMVAEKPVFEGSKPQNRLRELLTTNILVAYNAPFDIQVLKNENVSVNRYIDAYHLAKHLIQSEEYKLQYLRYFLELNVDGLPHDAMGDVLVLESLFARLVALVKEKFNLTTEEEILDKMLKLNDEPVLLGNFMFGKYRGKSFAEVRKNDRPYLQWLHGSESKKNQGEQDGDLIHTLEHFLKQNV